MIRIFSKGASVRLSVPSHVAGSAFDAWDVVGAQISHMGVTQTAVDIEIDDHVLAWCRWRPGQMQEQAIVLSRTIEPAVMAEIAESHEDEHIHRELRAVPRLHPRFEAFL